ncbi:MAG: GNAT family N-acetyltransferase [Asgard group archaeon]|nr:GNAT family N-acetyltransferase [Asgard group archaeon]
MSKLLNGKELKFYDLLSIMEENFNASLTFTIREFNLSDIDFIVEIWVDILNWHAEFDQEFILDPEGRTNFRFVLKSAFSDPSQTVYIALHEEEIVGFVYGYIKKHSGFFKKRTVAHVSDIAVKENYRRKGIGTALMRRFELDFARKNGVNGLSLYVHFNNEQGLNFYEKLGFDIKLASMRKNL